MLRAAGLANISALTVSPIYFQFARNQRYADSLFTLPPLVEVWNSPHIYVMSPVTHILRIYTPVSPMYFQFAHNQRYANLLFTLPPLVEVWKGQETLATRGGFLISPNRQNTPSPLRYWAGCIPPPLPARSRVGGLRTARC